MALWRTGGARFAPRASGEAIAPGLAKRTLQSNVGPHAFPQQATLLRSSGGKQGGFGKRLAGGGELLSLDRLGDEEEPIAKIPVVENSAIE